MILFVYTDIKPQNSVEIEKNIKEKYKQITDNFPDEGVLFEYINGGWVIAASDPVLHQLNELGNEAS